MTKLSKEPSTELSQELCEPCSKGAPRAAANEQAQWLKDLDEWEIVDKKGVLQLLKVYDFDNFVAAMEFGNKIGDLAEANGHHPALLVEWGRVTVRWWTHKIKGLHKNDFVMAAKTDSLSG